MIATLAMYDSRDIARKVGASVGIMILSLFGELSSAISAE